MTLFRRLHNLIYRAKGFYAKIYAKSLEVDGMAKYYYYFGRTFKVLLAINSKSVKSWGFMRKETYYNCRNNGAVVKL